MQGSAKPHPNLDMNSLISTFKGKKVQDISDGIKLKRGITYIFRLKESLSLKGSCITGQATGKSTFGRLDILTRLLTNNGEKYDEVVANYNGSLWIEVTPTTFPVIIEEGMKLNQLRLFKGNKENIYIKGEDLSMWGDLILDENGENKLDKERKKSLSISLTEDPKLENNICAFRAKEINQEDFYLDLRVDPGDSGYYNWEDYWEALSPSRLGNPRVMNIEKDSFYILRSRERFQLTKSVAVYCHAVTENLGELRIHYAGFVHPGFGTCREGGKGTPLIFEIRGHNIRTFLQDGETLARLNYYFMSADAPDNSISGDQSYNNQELKLSSYFKMEK